VKERTWNCRDTCRSTTRNMQHARHDDRRLIKLSPCTRSKRDSMLQVLMADTTIQYTTYHYQIGLVSRRTWKRVFTVLAPLRCRCCYCCRRQGRQRRRHFRWRRIGGCLGSWLAFITTSPTHMGYGSGRCCRSAPPCSPPDFSRPNRASFGSDCRPWDS
jgi:hypothetical protein